jgi:hypothetical protein
MYRFKSTDRNRFKKSLESLTPDAFRAEGSDRTVSASRNRVDWRITSTSTRDESTAAMALVSVSRSSQMPERFWVAAWVPRQVPVKKTTDRQTGTGAIWLP